MKATIFYRCKQPTGQWVHNHLELGHLTRPSLGQFQPGESFQYQHGHLTPGKTFKPSGERREAKLPEENPTPTTNTKD